MSTSIEVMKGGKIKPSILSILSRTTNNKRCNPICNSVYLAVDLPLIFPRLPLLQIRSPLTQTW